MFFRTDDTELGQALIGWHGESDVEVFWCALGDDPEVLKSEFLTQHSGATPSENESPIRALHGLLRGVSVHLRVVPNGTDFQLRVWKELSQVPRGQTRTYAEIAERLGLESGAARAVGAACGANPIALFIPCHRAVGSSGQLTGYRWGIDRKRRLLETEGALKQLTMF